MLTLVTSNFSKYEPFQRELERMRIGLELPKEELHELQSLTFSEALEAKAKSTAAIFGRPVLVDDAGLVLEAYSPFPGPLTSVVIRSLGSEGLARLLNGASDRARMECHIGCWTQGTLRHWHGGVQGRIDTSRQPRDKRMILSDIFVPDEQDGQGLLLHRSRALAALEADAFQLHLELGPGRMPDQTNFTSSPGLRCPFCVEIEADGPTVFGEMIGNRLASRIVYEDQDFVIMPPLGQFMAGGLLLLTRQHIPSFAFLAAEKLDRLESLVKVVCQTVSARWGVSPLLFEHGPAPEITKGVCCVDHAHFNIFPAQVQLHPHLAARMSMRMTSLMELNKLNSAEFGYLLVQENDGTRRVYDGQYVPTQLVRRIITSQMGMPERWHWRDYPGCDQLVETYDALKGQIRL
jgi:XTP/dITP diphosphohydrolase